MIDLAYLLSAILFVVGIKRLQSPVTARNGNALAALAMLIAIVVTMLDNEVLSWTGIIIGLVVGSLIGGVAARTVKMTSMPEMVGIFNAFGGGASALVAAAEFLRYSATGSMPATHGVTIMLGVLIGAVTFSGSFIAFGKLKGIISGNPITFPGGNLVNLLVFIALVVGGGYLAVVAPDQNLFIGFTVIALILGVLLVTPIGGADMPVVISLLNSYSGLAASATGFALGNNVLIISGALVGAAGLILTQIMCKAMNRSLANVAFGAFGGATAQVTGGASGDKPVRDTDAEGAAMMMAYAQSVIVVPGYGLAVAQAQHELRKVADLLGERGVDVKFAIHPVAGRMPGHMNVLLAEADVPYTQLYDLDEINDEFDRTDVVLVVGANDVVNPAAHDPNSVIAGMPILDVERARTVIVMKRSLSPGFAGIDNELFYMDKTYMFFGDARKAMLELAREVREV